MANRQNPTMTAAALEVSSSIIKAAAVKVKRSSFRPPDPVSMILAVGDADAKLMKPNPNGK